MLRLLTTARATGLLATSFIATAALADEFSHGSLLVSHPFAFATPPTARAGGGYMTITNTGPTDDRLLAVEAGFPRVMLHRSETTDGVSKMIHLDGVDIPAGETVTFAPGGLHVMFMGLTGHPFQDGRKVPARLIFEQAGEMSVTFSVERRGSRAQGNAAENSSKSDDHSDHN